MATSTEQINDLIGGYTDLKAYFEGARDDIEGRVQYALNATPDMDRIYYVNVTTGDDTNTGSIGAPLASIGEAISRTPVMGLVTIYLQSDYVWGYRVNVANKLVEIRSDDIPNTRRNISFSALPQAADVSIGGVTLIGANCWLHFYGCNIQFPEYTGGLGENSNYCNIVGTHTAQTKSLQHVGLTDCDIDLPAANGIGAVVSKVRGSVVLNVQNITDVNANMTGRYIRGASGSTPEQYASIVTNMTSL